MYIADGITKMKIDDNLMEFFFEDMESDDSVVMQNYSAKMLLEYVEKATDEEKQLLKSLIVNKDIEAIVSLISK